MTVRELRLYIESLRTKDRSPAEAKLSALLTALAAHDDMSIEDLIRFFTSRSKSRTPRERSAAAVAPVDAVSVVAKLRAAFDDDGAFGRALAQIEQQRSVTKAMLTQVFYGLFNRTRGVPKSATRADLLRLIADQRHILVRNEKMGRKLSRHPVPAE